MTMRHTPHETIKEKTMNDKELTQDDFLQRLDIREVLLDAGYRQNRRFGLRLSSFIRTDCEGKRIRGDKFVITQQGKCCSQPPRQKEYNVVSFIKEHPTLFAEYHEGIDPNRLVNLVCSRLLDIPVKECEVQTVPAKQDLRPFDITDYDLHPFNPQDREMQKTFYLYFKNRGIDLSTQNAFHRHFCLATRHGADGTAYSCLAFPLTLPKNDGKVVGFEERDCVRIDGSENYQDKGKEGNASEGLWIASPAGTPLAEAKHIYWFESACDAMAYYQLHQAQNQELSEAVFISTGGSPTVEQMQGVFSTALPARQHICFDTDLAGIGYTKNLQQEMYRAVRSAIEVTPERKPYLDTVPDGESLDCGEEELLPKDLLSKYGKYESAWIEAMSMRSSDLCHTDDIQAQMDIVNKHYKEFREGLREFLGLDKKNDASFVRERPAYPHKSWNELLLAVIKLGEFLHKEPVREEEPEQERQTYFRR